MMKTCDFLVVGAGIAGASAAYELAADGRVVVLEREDAPGYHSTGRSAAQFLESYGNAVFRRLARASRPFFENPPQGFADGPLLTPRGSLYLAREDQLGVLAAALAEARALAPSVRGMDCSDATRLVPILRRDYLAAAMYEPDSMDMDVHAIHHGYLKGLTGRGGALITHAEVTRLSRLGDGWVAETPAGAFAASIVVNAAGAWCDEVATLAGVDPVGLTPKRRTAITFDGPAELNTGQWPLVIDVEEDFYFKPEAGRILASPADETPVPPCDVQPEELDIAVTVNRVEKATTLKVRRISHRWAGLRSFVADKSPVVGIDDRGEGFCWLAGQGGYGIMTAPAMARAAAGLITTGRLPSDLADLGLKAADLAPARLRTS
ncbi:MAG: NAD(P)/FAD-dependent oxidoreductase [Alphaproteobacteria bacterium]